MTKKKPTEYYSAKVKEQIEALGLMFDEPAYKRTVALFQELKITQKQHDALILLHAQEGASLFNPTEFPIRARIFLALHFLGVVALIVKVGSFFKRIGRRIKRAWLGA